MATIRMTSGFKTCPEGVHIFRIYDVEYNEEFGKLVIKMVNAQGVTHYERFNLLNNDSTPNEKALNKFSFFAKTALNNFTAEEIDPVELVNHYIKAEVTHTVLPSKNDPNSTVTFVNIGSTSVADGFDVTPVEKALTLGSAPKTPTTTTEPKTATNGVDLNTLLG